MLGEIEISKENSGQIQEYIYFLLDFKHLVGSSPQRSNNRLRFFFKENIPVDLSGIPLRTPSKISSRILQELHWKYLQKCIQSLFLFLLNCLNTLCFQIFFRNLCRKSSTPSRLLTLIAGISPEVPTEIHAKIVAWVAFLRKFPQKFLQHFLQECPFNFSMDLEIYLEIFRRNLYSNSIENSQNIDQIPP